MAYRAFSPAPSDSRGTIRVLIAEDDPDGRWALRLLLTRLGLTCEVACNGQEAVEKAWTFAPTAILMDLRMPGMGGLEATRRLKTDDRTRHIPVLAVSANDSDGGAVEAYLAGCDSFSCKPLRVPDLLARLKRFSGRLEGFAPDACRPGPLPLQS